MANAYRDQNSVPTLIASSNADGFTPIRVYADPVTHRLLVDTGGAITGITSINADTTAAQLLVVGTAGTDFAIVDNGTGTHTFNLPTASAVNRGALSSADWTTFNGKQPAGSYITALTGDVTATGPGSVAATLATVNGNVGSFTYASITVNGKGLITAASSGAAPTGTVTTVSVATANGFAGTVANATTTPAITMSTTINAPILAGNATAISAATTTGTGSTAVLNNGPTLIAPILGTPASGNLVNCTGYTVANLAGLGANVGTWLATPSFTNLNAAVTGDSVVGLAATQTLTNKRITPRVLSAASYTTDTGSSINGDTQDMFIVTAQTGALKFNNPSGTPTDGQKLIISVASSTTAARALTWDTAYGATTQALPTTTAATTATLTIGFIWSTSKSLWQCVAVA